MPVGTERPPQVVLRVKNLERSAWFYRYLPDFTAQEEVEGVMRVIGPGGIPLLLAGPSADPTTWAGLPVAAPSAWVYLCRTGLPELAARLKGQGRRAEGPLEPYPGYRHLLLPDPDGYLLAFWESLPVTDDQILSLYQSGPTGLSTALEGLDEIGLDLDRAPGKWTVRQIVHHLVDSDLATFHVIRLALALPGSTIETSTWEPDDWMKGLDCRHRPIAPAVALFSAARTWVLEAVNHLPDALDRSVTWPSGYRAQVRDLLRQVGGHAQHHILQIDETRRRHGR